MSELVKGLSHAEQYFLEQARGSLEGEDYYLAEVCHKAIDRIEELKVQQAEYEYNASCVMATKDKRIAELEADRYLYKRHYEELEAQNRIFRNTESVDDSVWDALLEQVRTYQEKLDRVQGCQQYVLKGSGTPAEVMSGGTYMKTADVKSALGDEE